MKTKFKKLLKSILYPHIALIIILTVLSVVSLVMAFAVMPENQIVNYSSYVLSAYTLTVICIRIPSIIKGVKKYKKTNKYVSMYSSDPHLRIKLSLFGTLLFNVVYSLFQLALGIVGNSLWFYSLAGYYFLLALMRLALFYHTQKHSPGEMMLREQLIYRMCGIGLLPMTLALSVIIGYVAMKSQANVQGMIITIAMAAFTFTSFSIAIVNVFRYRKYNSPVWTASKALGFVSALVSMLTLEDAMIASFGSEEGENFRQTMAGFTGAGIVAVVIAIAIFMIINSTKRIKEYKNQNGASHEQLK